MIYIYIYLHTKSCGLRRKDPVPHCFGWMVRENSYVTIEVEYETSDEELE